VNTVIQEIQSLQLLQVLDTQIGEIEARLAQIPPEVDALEQRQQEMDNKIEAKVSELEEQRKMQRKLDVDLQTNEEKLVKFNVQLNQIKSNEEYRSMLKQIETIKYQNSEIESAILETYEELDSLKKQQAEMKKEAEIFKTSVQHSVSIIRAEENEMQQKKNELLVEFNEVRNGITTEILAHYDKLKNSKLTPAIVSIIDERCGGCYMNIRPKVLIEIKRNDKINYCENCSRFIFWKETEQPEETAGQS